MCEKTTADAALAATVGLSTVTDATVTQSQSETETQPQAQSQRENKPLPICFPKWRGKAVFDGNTEALAWTMVSIALAIQYVGSGAFLGTTILRIAEDTRVCRLNATGDETAAEINELCGPSLGMMQPTSLLTLYTMVIGFVAAFVLPFIGAIVDYTRHRLLIGRVMSFWYSVFLFPLMLLNEDNYIIILVCHGCSVFFGWFVLSLQFAYLPELTDSELQLADWTKWITIWTYTGAIAYLAGVIVVVSIVGRQGDDIFTCRVGMGVIFVVNAIILQVSWWVLFEKREPLHERPENSSLCTVGFKQLYNTGKHIVQNYRSLKWFYLSVCFSDAGWQSFGIFLLTFLTDFLDFTTTENGIAITISLLGSIPGAMIATFTSRRLDPIRSSKINMVFMILNVVAFVTVLTRPGQQLRTYILMFFIGLSGGWKFTMDRLISSSIIPEGQDTELMGLYLFAGQCLSWLPLMVFTIMNEAGISPRISVATLIVYISISFFSLCMVGSYTDARAEVERDTVYTAKDQREVTTVIAETNATIAVGASVVTEGIED